VGQVLRRLLGISLFGKVLIANSLIVVLGAIAGTWLTLQYAQLVLTRELHVELVAFFALVGIVLSIIINSLTLRLALRPLAELERTARRVQDGDLSARVTLGPINDPETRRLAETMNAMLTSLEIQRVQLQGHARRIQELSARVILAQEEERKRVARELHDETGQVLTSLAIGLKVLQGARTLADAQQQVQVLQELTHQALEGVHQLALELRPKMLDDLGLIPALRWYAGQWSQQVGIPVAFEAHVQDGRLTPEGELAIYRVVQEALTNVGRHAAARQVWVLIEENGSVMRVSVRDDGRGFDPERVAGAGPERRLGLFGMQERMALVGGHLEIDAAPGRGTRVVAEVPLATSAEGCAYDEQDARVARR
jgi:two-component system sensor histidine kinase UhpB